MSIEEVAVQWQRAIAVDFDGCLCDHGWPGPVKPNWHVINRLKAEKAAGSLIVLWTARQREDMTEALRLSEEWGVQYDAVNEDLPQTVETYGPGKKVFATEYWDDRARPVQDGVLRVSPYKMATVCKKSAQMGGPVAACDNAKQLINELFEKLCPAHMYGEDTQRDVAELIGKLECALEVVKYQYGLTEASEDAKDRRLDAMTGDLGSESLSEKFKSKT